MQQPLEPGQILNGKYKIVSLIGEGGMARVWLAEESAFGNRRVAIKEPKPTLDADLRADTQRRFQQELEINAALESVNAQQVVRTYTVESVGDSRYLVMAYMAGGDLDARIHAHKDGLPVETVIAVARSILTALQTAHQHPWEIVHRDVKPANILFDEAGNAYLADFGLAQLSGSSSNRTKLMGQPHPGTPTYMAPEQISSTAPLTPAADIYALGCVLFEMLTGKRYKRMKPGTCVTELRGDVPAWLNDLVARAVAEEPWERFEDATAMLTALESRQVDKAPGASPSTSPLRWLAALGAVVVITVLGWFAFQAATNLPGRSGTTPTAVSVDTGNPAAVTTETPTANGEAVAVANTATATSTPSPLPTPDLNATIAAGMAATQTAEPTATDTDTPTAEPIAAATATPDLDATVQARLDATRAAEATPTAMVIRINPAPSTPTMVASTPTATPTETATSTPSATSTPRPTATPTLRPNNTATAAMQTVIAYQSRTATPTPTHTPTPNRTATAIMLTAQAIGTMEAATVTNVAAKSIDSVGIPFDSTRKVVLVRTGSSSEIKNVLKPTGYMLTFNSFGPVLGASGKINPFAMPEIREALGLLIDRNYVVNNFYQRIVIPESVLSSFVGTSYDNLQDESREFEIVYDYNPRLANDLIKTGMETIGADFVNGYWQYMGTQIQISILINAQDERRYLGDYVATVLEDIGFSVTRDYRGQPEEISTAWTSNNLYSGEFHIYTSDWLTVMEGSEQSD